MGDTTTSVSNAMSNQPHPTTGIGLIAGYNRQLEATLQRRFKMTLGAYKMIESLAELAAVFLGFYAISQGADPLLVMLAVAVIIGGWKVVELLAVYADDISTVAEALDAASDTEEDND